VPPRICLQRLREDRFDLQLFEEINKLKKVWQGYQWLARRFPKNIFVVNGNQIPEKVFQDIQDILNRNKKFRNLISEASN
jgi:thymidylate kinase